MSWPLEAEKKDNLSRPDSPAPFDLDRAFAEAAAEIEFDWPEFLPVNRIKSGITEIALGFLLFAGLISLLWLPLNPKKETPATKASILPKRHQTLQTMVSGGA